MIYDYYAVTDVSGEKKNLKVYGEYDTKREADLARDKLQVRGCEVYAEVGGKLYRLICEQEIVRTDYGQAQDNK